MLQHAISQNLRELLAESKPEKQAAPASPAVTSDADESYECPPNTCPKIQTAGFWQAPMNLPTQGLRPAVETTGTAFARQFQAKGDLALEGIASLFSKIRRKIRAFVAMRIDRKIDTVRTAGNPALDD